MKKHTILLLTVPLLWSLLLCGCDDGVETLTPSEETIINFFAPDPSDKSAEAELKRSFYDNTGIYLLFSETLGKYVNSKGIEKVEKIDFNFNLTSSGTSTYVFDELSEDEKETATKLVEKYFIPYINVEGGSMKPYSVLLVKNIKTGSYLNKATYLTTMRCFAINVSDWLDGDEEYSKSLGMSLLRTLIDQKLTYSSPELEPFYAVCQDCYDAYYISEIDSDWADLQDPEIVYNLGFTDYYEDFWGDGPEYDEFPSESSDLKLFKNEIFNKTEDEFLDDWGDYPKIVEKYYILKGCIEKLGVNFNAVK